MASGYEHSQAAATPPRPTSPPPREPIPAVSLNQSIVNTLPSSASPRLRVNQSYIEDAPG